jgi:hypothetical protein
MIYLENTPNFTGAAVYGDVEIRLRCRKAFLPLFRVEGLFMGFHPFQFFHLGTPIQISSSLLIIIIE